MCRGEDTHDHQIRCRCCDPAQRRQQRHSRQLRDRGLPDDVKIDEVWASGTISQRELSARSRPEATYDPAPAVRAERARNGHLSTDEQNSLATDLSPKVRLALAQNPRITHSAREALAGDENPRVRGAARARQRFGHAPKSAIRATARKRGLKLLEVGSDAILNSSEAMAERVEAGLAAVPDVLDEAFGLEPLRPTTRSRDSRPTIARTN